MLFYADEDFALEISKELRRLGHDVLTVQEDGKSSTPDHDVLARAHALGRALLTHNRRHFERLHRQGAAHSGIVSAKQNPGKESEMGKRIDEAAAGLSLGRWCIRVNRPP